MSKVQARQSSRRFLVTSPEDTDREPFRRTFLLAIKSRIVTIEDARNFGMDNSDASRVFEGEPVDAASSAKRKFCEFVLGA